MEAVTKRKLSLAEYQQLEETTDTKYEYHDGEVFAMSGTSRMHSAIASNVIQQVSNALPEGCRSFDSDLKVYIESARKGLHPDVSVACRPITGPDEINAIDNPVLLFEILSPSTSAYDRGQKFWFFSQLPSLREYVLIEQDKWAVEVRYRSSADQDWVMAYYEGEDAEVLLRSLDLRLSLRQIYHDTDGL